PDGAVVTDGRRLPRRDRAETLRVQARAARAEIPGRRQHDRPAREVAKAPAARLDHAPARQPTPRIDPEHPHAHSASRPRRGVTPTAAPAPPPPCPCSTTRAA